jgi:hypothetical protein
VEEVDNLNGTGELFVGEVPDPRRAVAQDDAARGMVEAAAAGFAVGALGER